MFKNEWWNLESFCIFYLSQSKFHNQITYILVWEQLCGMMRLHDSRPKLNTWGHIYENHECCSDLHERRQLWLQHNEPSIQVSQMRYLWIWPFLKVRNSPTWIHQTISKVLQMNCPKGKYIVKQKWIQSLVIDLQTIRI